MSVELKITSTASGRPGRVGLLVNRQTTGQTFALASGHALRWGMARGIDGQEVGMRTASQHFDADDGNRIEQLIAFIRILALQGSDIGSQLNLNPAVAKPLELIGEDVRIVLGPKNDVVGRISAVQAPVIMNSPQGGSQKYTNAMIVAIKETCLDSLRGEAGALVVSSDYKPAGILLAIGSGVAVLSPLYELFRRELFQIALEYSLDDGRDPFPAIYRRCALHPGELSTILQEERARFHSYCRELSKLRGRPSMEYYQNEVAHTLFHLTGFETFSACLLSSMLRSDAPFDIANDNWLWRASVERLRIIIPSLDGRRLTQASEPRAEILVGDGGDVELARVAPIHEGSRTMSSLQDVVHLADRYLGKNDVEFELPTEDE